MALKNKDEPAPLPFERATEHSVPLKKPYFSKREKTKGVFREIVEGMGGFANDTQSRESERHTERQVSRAVWKRGCRK